MRIPHGEESFQWGIFQGIFYTGVICQNSNYKILFICLTFSLPTSGDVKGNCQVQIFFGTELFRRSFREEGEFFRGGGAGFPDHI